MAQTLIDTIWVLLLAIVVIALGGLAIAIAVGVMRGVVAFLRRRGA